MSENSCLHFSEHFPHGSVAMCRAQDVATIELLFPGICGGSVVLPRLTGLKVSPSDTASSQVCSDFLCRCKLELFRFGIANWKRNCGLLWTLGVTVWITKAFTTTGTWTQDGQGWKGPPGGHLVLSFQAGFPRAHSSELCPQTAFGCLQRKLPNLSGFGT